MFEKAIELDPQYAEAYAAWDGPTYSSGSSDGVRTSQTLERAFGWRKGP